MSSILAVTLENEANNNRASVHARLLNVIDASESRVAELEAQVLSQKETIARWEKCLVETQKHLPKAMYCESELGVCRHANQQHSEQIARLRDNIRSYGDAQVWYTHALAVLRHVRYASSELLDVVDAHNRFAEACVGQVIVPEKQIADVRDALIKSDEFFAPAGGTPS